MVTCFFTLVIVIAVVYGFIATLCVRHAKDDYARAISWLKAARSRLARAENTVMKAGEQVSQLNKQLAAMREQRDSKCDERDILQQKLNLIADIIDGDYPETDLEDNTP